ncbi:putative zeaxanthin epoxidase [Medicago truncatula]|uniref:Zeaxanthin epoxidase, chloroplastic n=2 Tax=Medicago truncatula TaxID=3880 RepID=A0A072UD31_MEDTR|nr:zeaxanthin epoxidase, chloroplastic isoform X1 [Medicago truncatula]KEH27527.1 zeaxanthin epoxidase [Medicago truncatula]RHN54026.1 putative zeaxanthin epoxidase [Medicago truncatula]
MVSTLSHKCLSPSMTTFSRTHFSNPFVSYGNRTTKQRRKLMQVKATVMHEAPFSVSKSTHSVAEIDMDQTPQKKQLKVLVAGGGIGGLVFALAAKRKGFEVVVFEKDLSAIRGEGQYRGPIQIQSNALAALEAIDMNVADEVMRVGCITGDRINGLVDGVSGSWYIKFDTFTPAAERGLPVTRVISRMALQEILARAVGDDVIMNGSNVVDFIDHETKVTVVLDNGQKYDGDLLVGADGIWSKVRTKLFGSTEATYSGYTCYTGIADFVPPDIESVGYRVFLGHKQYFVSSDVGAGKMQWYAFHQEPAGGVDTPNGKKERLLKIFEGWCDNAIDLIVATEEEAILRRDIYDRTPTLTWGKGRVTLLGDSVHAMQPNMGQGGCMAIEDGYQLAFELDNAWQQSAKSGSTIDIASSLKSYERERRLRVTFVHGMARMAALMASTYKAYLGVGLGPFEFLTKFRIPHPGRVGGRFFIQKSMPLMLNWVLGGNSSKLEGRPLCCRLSDKASDQLHTWFEDDDALERTINGEWILLPCGDVPGHVKPISLNQDDTKPYIIGNTSAMSIEQEDYPGSLITIPLPQVSQLHARINFKDGAFFLTDLRSQHGTWITDNEGRRYMVSPNYPARIRPSHVIEFGCNQASYRVKVTRSAPRVAQKEGAQILQKV